MRTLRLWGPVAAWCALIFAVSSLPSIETGLSWDWPLRKLAHLFEYAVLSLLLLRALRGQRLSPSRPSHAAWAVLLSVLYGVSDEVHQTSVPGREGKWADVVIDAVGAAAAVAASSRLRR